MLNPIEELFDLVEKLGKQAKALGYTIDASQEWPAGKFEQIDGKMVPRRTDPFVMTVTLTVPPEVMEKLSK